MTAARIAAPVYTLGPGARAALWVSGCKKRCPGCANPELWEFDSEKDLPALSLAELVIRAGGGRTDGFTITGGEPFDQPEELAELVNALRPVSGDILVYTGYTLAELQNAGGYAAGVLNRIAVLIDGRYVESLNNGSVLRGSDNQTVHILNGKYKALYETALAAGGGVQNIPVSGGVYSIGIHRRGFKRELSEGAAAFGLEEL